MSDIKTIDLNGGPAFPCPQDSINQNMPSLGMTLRDYFAAQAMPVLLTKHKPFADYEEICELAEKSYDIADAMLKVKRMDDGIFDKDDDCYISLPEQEDK